MNEFRKDLVSGKWIITGDLEPESFLERVRNPQPRQINECPFCEGAESRTLPEVYAVRPAGGAADGPGWKVRVAPSREAYMRIEGVLGRMGEGIYDRMNNIGAHELLIECPNHVKNMSRLDEGQTAWSLAAMQARLRDLEGDPRFRYALIFKNQRPESPNRYGHAHSHIVALPAIPTNIKVEIENAKRYYMFKDRCMFCDIIRQELDFGKRIVEDTDRYAAFVPFASSCPFEIWIAPKQHQADFGQEPELSLTELAGILKRCLLRIDIGLGDPLLNFVIHTAPYERDMLDAWKRLGQGYHWHIEILPHVVEQTGYEWGSGERISLIPPEKAAAFLRGVDLGL